MKKLITFQVDDDYANKIKDYAKSNYMTITSFIKRAIDEYIEQH